MLAETIYFAHGELKFMVGIKAEFRGDEHTVHLFSKKGRDVALPLHPEHPPNLEYSSSEKGVSEQHLGLLSLVINPPFGLRAIKEIDHKEKVLIFIDTYSEDMPEQSHGQYSFPDHYHGVLPHGMIVTKFGPAHFGLAICAPGETCCILSTSGKFVKIKLIAEGKFVRVPFDAFERGALQGTMHGN